MLNILETNVISICGSHPLNILFLNHSLGKETIYYRESNNTKNMSQCGYNKKTKKEIFAVLAKFSADGFTTLYATANAGYIIHVLKNWRTEEEKIGKLIRITYTWNVPSVGVLFSLLKRSEINIPYLKEKFFPAICAYLTDEIDSKIQLDITMI